MCSNSNIVKKSFHLENKSSCAKILQVHHTVYLPGNEVKRLIFVSVVFDSECKRFACSDHRGNVFVFDLEVLKYWKLPDISSYILAFSPCKRSYIILAKSNSPFEVSIVNAENGLQKCSAMGHRFQAKTASFSMKGDLLITANKVEALVWETHRYTLCYELKIDKMNLKNILFTPVTDHILAHFVDYTIQMWNKNTLQVVDQRILENFNNVQHFSYTKDGRCVVLVSGTPTTISLLNGGNWQCIRRISLRISSIQDINKMFFLDDENEKHSRKLVIHTKDGLVFLMDLEKLYHVQLFTDVKPKHSKNISLSPNGKYIARIYDSGEIDINDVTILMRKLKDKKMARSTLTLLNDKPERGAGEDHEMECTHEIHCTVSRQKLLGILKHFYEYPENNRFKIWRQLLQLPLNHDAYCKLLVNPANTKYLALENFLRINNKVLFMHMKKILCLITSLCPVLENVDYLPIQVFPFIKLLHKDPLFCFETIVSVLINYCQMWYNYDSHPPTDVLLIVDSVLEQHDSKLYKHYQKLGISSNLYAFSLMKSLFSESFHSKDWLQLWDHILSNEPSFILMAIVAYNIVNRNVLLNYNDVKQFELFFDKGSRSIDMKSFINETYDLLRTTKSEIHPKYCLKKFKGLEKTMSYSEINLVDMHIEIK